MTDRLPEIDSHSGVETTGHEWDGIRELNNPLPRWWRFVFWATVAFSVVYWILMPAWPALPGMQGNTPGIRGQSDRADMASEVTALRAERSQLSAKLASMDATAILKDRELSELALALGESAFGDNCATCHGIGGRGAKGYPQLADDVWLWGGSLPQIEYTIRHGVRSGAGGAHELDMPAFGRDAFLAPDQISDLVEYVMAVSGREADRAAVERAAPVFLANCASCHGEDAHGGKREGAPNLTDAEWLYAGDRATILASVNGPRSGVMPAWQARLDPATVRALAVYVHSLGGGQ
jgi:cytochrome c oxidase cbb3-type subunit 3